MRRIAERDRDRQSVAVVVDERRAALAGVERERGA
jgi:hypothetical protein